MNTHGAKRGLHWVILSLQEACIRLMSSDFVSCLFHCHFSSAWVMQRRMTEVSLKWKEWTDKSAEAYFKIPSTTTRTSVTTFGLRGDNRTRDLQKKKQTCQPLQGDVRFHTS